jgi:ATPase family associated with various cellular activities (AAA)/Domain of unknown function (DUF5925)
MENKIFDGTQLVHEIDGNEYNKLHSLKWNWILKNGLIHSWSATIDDVEGFPDLKELECLASHSVRSGRSLEQLYRFKNSKDKALLNVENRWGVRQIRIFAFFKTQAERERLTKKILEHFPYKEKVKEEADIYFYSSGEDGPERTRKSIKVPSWEEIQGNYSNTIVESLQEVMKSKPGADNGHLMLWRGPSGTGKTWAIRALAREWRDWCTFNYIIDPDVFFSRANYMVNVLTQMSASNDYEYEPEDEDEERTPFRSRRKKAAKAWNLLILEDAGELISLTAKADTGQALSKLLNLTDGLLGQGVNLLVLITTNEDYKDLHKAIARHGRCMSNLYFGALSEKEAKAWLEGKDKVDRAKAISGDMSLSELYAISAGRDKISGGDSQVSIGFRRDNGTVKGKAKADNS